LPEFTAASREHLWTQHRGNFKSTPHKNNCNSPEVKGLQRVSQTLTGQQCLHPFVENYFHKWMQTFAQK
jgi:hypothetical protein